MADIWTQSSFNLFFQWWTKQNIFKHLWKHSRLLNKYPPWIVRTLHCRSLFKRLKSYIVVVEFHFLARLKALGLKYSKAWFPWSRLSRKDLKQSYSTRPFKVHLLGRGEEFMTKVTKSNKGLRECSQKLMSLSSFFSMPIFSSIEFWILCISCRSDNVKVNSIKTHPRGFLCVCYSYITRSKVVFCQCDFLVPVYLCVKVNARKWLRTLAFDLLYLSSHIYRYIHRYIYEYEASVK